jgi:hypothetical protein
MGITNLREPLRKRYSALTGELEDVRLSIERIKREAAKLSSLEQRIPDLVRQIETTRTVLKDIDPDWNPDDERAVRPWTHTIPVPFGQCGRRALTVLRISNQPMTVRQVTLQVLAEVGCDEPDRAIIQRVQAAVESSFRKFKGRTVESSGKYPAQWRAINKPDLLFDP